MYESFAPRYHPHKRLEIVSSKAVEMLGVFLNHIESCSGRCVDLNVRDLEPSGEPPS